MAKIPKRKPGPAKPPPWPQGLDPRWHQTDIFEQLVEAGKDERRRRKGERSGK